MKKKLISVLVAAAMLFQPCAFAVTTQSKAACVINSMTGEIVYEQNCDERLAMASTTKIMTAIIALENSNWSDVVTVSANAASTEGSAAYISEGDQVNMIDLLYGLMLNSGNDASVAIAEHIAGSVDAFVDMMNAKAWSIGANNTQFMNPSGLNSDYHFTTAHDLALITRYAMWKPEFREIVSAKEYAGLVQNTGQILIFANHNKLLSTYDGAIGVKTGYTEAAGRCLVSAANRDNMEFIAVTLNDPNDWEDHKELLDSAFNEYYPKRIIAKGDVIKKASIDGKNYTFSAENDVYVPMKTDEQRHITLTNYLVREVNAPVNAGEKIGFVDVRVNGAPACTVNIVSDEDIHGVSMMRLRKSFFGSFKKALKELLI